MHQGKMWQVALGWPECWRAGLVFKEMVAGPGCLPGCCQRICPGQFL